MRSTRKTIPRLIFQAFDEQSKSGSDRLRLIDDHFHDHHLHLRQSILT